MPALFLRRVLVGGMPRGMPRVLAWSLALCSLAWSATVWAEPVSEPGVEPVAQQAYQHMDHLRAQEAAQYQAQQAECYTRFAVNGCLRDAHSRHRAVLADLQRQQKALHEQDRLYRGAQALQRTRQKAQEHQEKQQQAAQAGSSAAEKMQAQQDRQAAHAEQVAQAAQTARSAKATPATQTPVSHSSAPRPDKASSQLTAAQQAENRAAYQRKLQQAETRRQEAAKRQAEKKPAAALPLPGWSEE